MKQIYKQCAAIDIGSKEIFIGILNSDGFKRFGTTTVDFKMAGDYLQSKQIKFVAMEATGVYWMGLYSVLDTAGFEVTLVKAGDAKQLPGRDKTDGEDCQWLCELFSKGLLRKSVIPSNAIRELRQFMRLRQDHVEMAAQHKQHIQKFLIMMNIRLSEVISDITGVTGKKMVEAILRGERDPQLLLAYCHGTIKADKNQILKSLQGIYRKELLFGLEQSYQGWCFYQNQIYFCDQQINQWLEKQIQDKPKVTNDNLKRSGGGNKLQIPDIEEKLLTLNGGIDVTRLPGIGTHNALKLISELGHDLTKWPTEKCFAKYLGLAGVKSNSGQIKSQKRMPVPKAGQIFRESAQVLMRSNKTALGAFARRINARRGARIAIKATARKLAILYYNLFTKGYEYVEKGINLYEEQVKNSQLKRLEKQARKYGFALINASTQ